MELVDEVRAFLIETLSLADVKPESLRPETPIFGPTGLGLDSLDALELAVQLKRRFKVTIDDAQVGERAFRSFGSLVELIRQGQTGASG